MPFPDLQFIAVTEYRFDIYSNNMVTISLSHSHFPLSLWKDDNLSIFLMKKGKPALLPQIVFLCIISKYLVLFYMKLIVLGRLTCKLVVKIS